MDKEISCGAVPYRKTDKGIEYLVVIDRNNNYGFPKGHQEKGETYKETAAREIKEEVGLDLVIENDFCCRYEYPIKKNTVIKEVRYFLADFAGQKPYINDGEIKEILIKNYEEAMKLLNFAQSRELLKKAQEYLNRS